MFKTTSIDDLYRLEGARHPQLVVEEELERLGGGGFAGIEFRIRVLKAAGYDVAKPPSDQQKIDAYNKVAEVLNSLPDPRTKSDLGAAMGITA